MWRWYNHSPKYYGNFTSPNKPYASGLQVSNFPKNGSSSFESYKSINSFWKEKENTIQKLERTKTKSVIQRCWGEYPTHEQGCFHHVFHGLEPQYRKSIASQINILKASEMHALRLMDPLPNKNFIGSDTAPFLHYCCASYKERVEGMKKCRLLLLRNIAC